MAIAEESNVDRETSPRARTGWDMVASGADRLLNRKRLKHYPAFLLAASVVVCIVSVLTGSLPFDAFDRPLAIDLSAYVTGARMVLNGDIADLYSADHQHAVQVDILGGTRPEFFDVFIAPPFVAYAYVPFALIPYTASAVLWMVLTVALLAVSLRLLWPLVPNLHGFGFSGVLVILLASAPAIEVIAGGQNSAVTLLLLSVGLRLLLRFHDRVAGVVLGLGVFKPQLVALLPFFFIAARRWSALVAWIGAAIALAVTSVLMVGVDGVRAYMSLMTSDIYQEQLLGDLGWKMRTVGALLRSLAPESYLPASVATMISLIVLVAGAGLVFITHRVFHHQRAPHEAFLLSFATTVLITATFAPHAFNYDSVVLLVPFVIYLQTFPTSHRLRVAILAAYLIALSAPLRYFAFSATGLPLSVLAGPLDLVPVLWCVVIVIREINQSATSRTPDPQPESIGRFVQPSGHIIERR